MTIGPKGTNPMTQLRVVDHVIPPAYGLVCLTQNQYRGLPKTNTLLMLSVVHFPFREAETNQLTHGSSVRVSRSCNTNSERAPTRLWATPATIWVIEAGLPQEMDT